MAENKKNSKRIHKKIKKKKKISGGWEKSHKTATDSASGLAVSLGGHNSGVARNQLILSVGGMTGGVGNEEWRSAQS